MITAPRYRNLEALVTCWTIGLTTFFATRYRGQWSAITSLHKWMASLGIPKSIRNLDSLLIYVASAALAAVIIARRNKARPTDSLLIKRGCQGWLPMSMIALAPMIIAGFILSLPHLDKGIDWTAFRESFISGTIRAPLSEELLFRALLVAIPAAVIHDRRTIILTTIAAATLFGSAHVPWTPEGIAKGWPNFLVTFLGGIWYVWLMLRWQTLFVPIILHAGMNFAWLLAGASGGAGGGSWTINLTRVATITLATIWTVKTRRTQSDS